MAGQLINKMRLHCNTNKIMKRIGYTLLLLVFACGFANAQPIQRDKARENIKAIKVGYLTEKLKLTPEQATKFWPVYN